MDSLCILLSFLFSGGVTGQVEARKTSPLKGYEVEAQRRIWKNQDARARKRAIADALKKSVNEAAARFVQGAALRKAKRALRKSYKRFISSYRLLGEQKKKGRRGPIYWVKLQVQVDLVGLKRALQPPGVTAAGKAAIATVSASLTPSSLDVGRILPAQVALESSLRARGFAVISSLASNSKSPVQIQITGSCKLLSSGTLPGSKKVGATAECNATVFPPPSSSTPSASGSGSRSRSSAGSSSRSLSRLGVFRITSTAGSFSHKKQKAVEKALVLAGIELGRQIATKIAKGAPACSRLWKLHVTGAVGLAQMLAFKKALSGALSSTAKVRPIAFRRGVMVASVSLPRCRDDMSRVVQGLNLPNLVQKVGVSGPHELNVTLKPRSPEESLQP